MLRVGVLFVFHIKPYPDNVEPLRNTPVEAVNVSCLFANSVVKDVFVIITSLSHLSLPVKSDSKSRIVDIPASLSGILSYCVNLDTVKTPLDKLVICEPKFNVVKVCVVPPD